MKELRIKTEKELLLQYGDRWRSFAGFNTYGEMDYLLGKKISDLPILSNNTNTGVIKIKNENPHRISQFSWSIFSGMLTETDITPNYKPRKLIKE